ncbi:hypothetical protein C349_04754, partial [Cryptococcus neoformans var. grubii Br795]
MSVNTQESQGLTHPPLPTPSLRLNFDNSPLNLVEMLMYGSVDGVMASLSPWVARAAWIVMPKRSDSPQKLQWLVEGDSGQAAAAELGGILGQSLALNVVEILGHCFTLGIPELGATVRW